MRLTNTRRPYLSAVLGTYKGWEASYLGPIGYGSSFANH